MAAGTLRLGLETECPGTIRGMVNNTCGLVCHVRGLCDECRLGHEPSELNPSLIVPHTEWEYVDVSQERVSSPAKIEDGQLSPCSCDDQVREVPETERGFLARIFDLVTGKREPNDGNINDSVHDSVISSVDGSS